MSRSNSVVAALLACALAPSVSAQALPGGTVDVHGFVNVTGLLNATVDASVPNDADADAVAGAPLDTKAFSAHAGNNSTTPNGVSKARGRASAINSSTRSRAYLGMTFDIGGIGPNAVRNLDVDATATATFKSVDVGSWLGLPGWGGMPPWMGTFTVKGEVRCRLSGRAYAHNVPFPALPGVDVNAEISVAGHGVVLQRDEDDPPGSVSATIGNVTLPVGVELHTTVNIDGTGNRRVHGGIQSRVDFVPTEISWNVGGLIVQVWVAS